MSSPVLYDANGQRINLEALREERGAPALASIRNVWFSPIAPGLSPERLANLLNESVHGMGRGYLTLAEEMEERDLHYAAQLRTRKLAVSSIPVTIEPPKNPDASEQKIASALSDVVERPEFRQVIPDLLDALGKSYSVVEIIWQRGATWEPTYKWRDPRWFRHDLATGEQLHLLDEKDPANGIPLEPYKWIVHYPRLKTGLPIRGGLARLVAASYMCKSFNLRSWLAFAEVFGMPLRLGKYGPKALPEDIDKLISAVANLGSDAAAVVPDSMKIDILNAANGVGGGPLFEGLAKYLDAQVSKAVLGQTMTADDGSSHSQARVHNEVRHDIRDSDAGQIEATLDIGLVRPYVDLNFGPQKRYPRLRLLIEEKADLVVLATALAPLIDRGLPVAVDPILAKFRLSKPEAGQTTLRPLKSGAAPAAVPSEDGENKPALNREEPTRYRDDIDDMRDELLRDWKPLIRPDIDALTALAAQSQSFAEFQSGLARLQVDNPKLTESLALALFQSAALGNTMDKV